jgi:hypothetical protein
MYTCPAQLTKISQSIVPLSVVTLETALFFVSMLCTAMPSRTLTPVEPWEIYWNLILKRISSALPN